MMTPGDIDKLQKECDFEYMKEMIDKQQTQIRELTDKKNVVDLDYKKVLKENEELNLKYYMLYTGKIENLKAQEVKIKSQVIPVQKVKDKIEEIKQEKEKYGNCLIKMYKDELVNRDIKILQELLVSN